MQSTIILILACGTNAMRMRDAPQRIGSLGPSLTQSLTLVNDVSMLCLQFEVASKKIVNATKESTAVREFEQLNSQWIAVEPSLQLALSEAIPASSADKGSILRLYHDAATVVAKSRVELAELFGAWGDSRGVARALADLERTCLALWEAEAAHAVPSVECFDRLATAASAAGRSEIAVLNREATVRMGQSCTWLAAAAAAKWRANLSARSDSKKAVALAEAEHAGRNLSPSARLAKGFARHERQQTATTAERLVSEVDHFSLKKLEK